MRGSNRKAIQRSFAEVHTDGADYQRRLRENRGKAAAGPVPLLTRLLVRSGAATEVMPPEVRKLAPKRVQEAMQVVEDYVESLDRKGGSEAG